MKSLDTAKGLFNNLRDVASMVHIRANTASKQASDLARVGCLAQTALNQALYHTPSLTVATGLFAPDVVTVVYQAVMDDTVDKVSKLRESRRVMSDVDALG